MKYILLLTMDRPAGELPDPSDAETRRSMQRYAALKQEFIDEGVWCGGQALQPASMATGVQVRRRQVVLHDGPFVETSDQLLGYYLVDCQDLDHAVDVASRIPAATYGSVEIRPVWDYEAFV